MLTVSERQVIRIRQLPRSTARRAEEPYQRPVAREDLDAMVAGVGDVEVAVRTQRQRPDARELTRLRTGSAPALDELAVGRELADAVRVVELRDIVEAVGIDDRVGDVAELARSVALGAAEGPPQLG